MFINSTYKHPLNSGCGPRTPTNPHFNHKIVWGTHVSLFQTLTATCKANKNNYVRKYQEFTTTYFCKHEEFSQNWSHIECHDIVITLNNNIIAIPILAT